MSFRVGGPRNRLCVRFSHSGNFSVAPTEIRDSNIFCVLLNNDLVRFAFTLSTSQIYMVKMMLVRQDHHFFKNFFHMGAIFCFFPAMLMTCTYTDYNNPCFRWTNGHSQFGTFFHPSSNRTSSNCLTHKRPASGWTHKFRSRGTAESSMLAHDLAICVVDDVSIYLDILTLELWAIWEGPQILPGCRLIQRQLLVHHSLVV